MFLGSLLILSTSYAFDMTGLILDVSALKEFVAHMSASKEFVAHFHGECNLIQKVSDSACVCCACVCCACVYDQVFDDTGLIFDVSDSKEFVALRVCLEMVRGWCLWLVSLMTLVSFLIHQESDIESDIEKKRGSFFDSTGCQTRTCLTRKTSSWLICLPRFSERVRGSYVCRTCLTRKTSHAFFGCLTRCLT